jgi:hypothetical protein
MISAPSFFEVSCGSTPLPALLLILWPLLSTVKPWVRMAL